MLDVIIGWHMWNCQICTHIHTKIHAHTYQKKKVERVKYHSSPDRNDHLTRQYPGWSTNNPHERAPPRSCTPLLLAHSRNNSTHLTRVNASPIGKHTIVSIHACLSGVHARWNMRRSMRASIACMLAPYNMLSDLGWIHYACENLT